jgi:hypothetical protein
MTAPESAAVETPRETNMPLRARILRVLVALAIFATTAVYAMLPENGWYWNRNESGRGFNIEIQNNVLSCRDSFTTLMDMRFGLSAVAQ